MVEGNHWDQWFSDGFGVRQPLVTMVFDGCAPLVQRWNGYVPSLKSNLATFTTPDSGILSIRSIIKKTCLISFRQSWHIGLEEQEWPGSAAHFWRCALRQLESEVGLIAWISDRWSGNDKAILKLLFESHVLVRIDILRYLGNGSQQMGLLVDGVSLLDGGEWVVQIRFGPRWVAVPFEVLLGDGDQDVSGFFLLHMFQVLVDNKTSIKPSLRSTSELPIHVQVYILHIYSHTRI